MNILVLMPMYKVMETACVQSLIGFQNEVYDKDDRLKFVFTNGFNAAKSRNLLANYAATTEEEFDFILWLDSDHIYQAQAMYDLYARMKEKDLPLLSASYKVRGGDITAHGKYFKEEEAYRQFKCDDLKEIVAGEVCECDVLGFGFMVMEKDFLKAMHEKYGNDLFILDNADNATEDVQFCKLVKQEGYKVCFDPNIKIGHIQIAVRI